MAQGTAVHGSACHLCEQQVQRLAHSCDAGAAACAGLRAAAAGCSDEGRCGFVAAAGTVGGAAVSREGPASLAAAAAVGTAAAGTAVGMFRSAAAVAAAAVGTVVIRKSLVAAGTV